MERGGSYVPQSREKEKPEGQFEYKGRKIAYKLTDQGADLTIDGVPIISPSRIDGQYHTHMFMYRSFPTVEALAKALVDTEGKTWILRQDGAMPMPRKM
jgi:hypothetical protein